MNVNELLSKTLTEVNVNKSNDEISFKCTDGTEYLMYHNQDCCESVSIEDITGDLNDLLNEPITMADETSNQKDIDDQWGGSSTWTFYNFATVKGYVTIRWLGSSNGYYSESVNFKQKK